MEHPSYMAPEQVRDGTVNVLVMEFLEGFNRVDTKGSTWNLFAFTTPSM